MAERTEERQPQDMVEMKVGQQSGGPHRRAAVGVVGGDGDAQRPQPRPEIEDDQFTGRGPDEHARGVAPVPAVLLTGTRT